MRLSPKCSRFSLFLASLCVTYIGMETMNYWLTSPQDSKMHQQIQNDVPDAIRIIHEEPSIVLNQPYHPITNNNTTIATTTTTAANLSKPGPSTVLCTQQQRLSRMDEMCRRYHGSAPTLHSQNAFIDSMTDAEIVPFSETYFVLPEFKVIGCLNWKTACTTWRTIMKRNSIDGVQPNEVKWENSKDGKMRQLNEFNATEIRHMFKTYFKFVTARHPLSRLLSAYKDKVLGEGSDGSNIYHRHLSARIKKSTRKTNSTSFTGQNITDNNVTFTEFLQFIRDGGKDLMLPSRDGHWHTLMLRCQPCKLNYDQVVRVESMTEDAQYIVEHKLRGYGLDVKANFRGNVGGTGSSQLNFQSLLPEYAGVSDGLFQTTIDRYDEDFHVYGYNFTRMQDGRVRTACSSGYNNGVQCC